jgi:hypothetical protein
MVWPSSKIKLHTGQELNIPSESRSLNFNVSASEISGVLEDDCSFIRGLTNEVNFWAWVTSVGIFIRFCP